MIKLERGEKPEYLTDAQVEALTKKFKANSKEAVWKHKDIKSALLLSSNSKCAFCECELMVSGSYMEIEHFKLKNDYPEEVVSWENLLPSCKRCNTTKGTHDVVAEPIINPFDINPKDHLSQCNNRIYAKTPLGESTTVALNLNDESLTRPRFFVSDYVTNKIEEIYQDISSKSKLTRHDRNKLSTLLTSCQADHAFSAFASTALHDSHEYVDVVTMLKTNKLWDERMEELHQCSRKLILDRREKIK
ncbi:TPA: hypothetical protein JI050_11095 [Acinetobacter baumannii]|nr:hypothetical protein [Acinetobacter baumannii]HAV5348534.1 hypothetical protein [Acinetobacter baumannii]HAV5353372.1 hypothetical protein [Acinetobacter baumannii]HAV5476211.1 hypothetical protein [Acinetobacter baumannii]HAV5481619.1 hypothetical protein [Acinetobacter baumannii]